MPKVRVHNLAISLDGYAAGPDQSLDNPLGVGSTRLHDWVFATRSGRRTHGMEGGDEGTDDHFVAPAEAALERALDAANGNDVRVGDGPATIQQYLRPASSTSSMS